MFGGTVKSIAIKWIDICKLANLFFISLTKLVLKAKASICSRIKENLLSHCRNILVFVIAIII